MNIEEHLDDLEIRIKDIVKTINLLKSDIKPKKTCYHNVKIKHSCEQCGRVKKLKGKKIVKFMNLTTFGNITFYDTKIQAEEISRSLIKKYDMIAVKVTYRDIVE